MYASTLGPNDRRMALAVFSLYNVGNTSTDLRVGWILFNAFTCNRLGIAVAAIAM